MNKDLLYTESANLDNARGCLTFSKMNDQIDLLSFVDAWLELFKKNSVKEATYARLMESRRQLANYPISKMRICDISFFDIQTYINQLVDHGYSLTSLKKQALVVTAPLRQAAAMRVIKADPCIGIRMPVESKMKKKTKELIAYTEAEQRRIDRTVSIHPDSVGYLAVRFLIETGLRAGELLALKWSDVSVENRKLRVHATIVHPLNTTSGAAYQDSAKSRSSNRVIPLTLKAVDILKLLWSRRQTEWVFEQDGERYSYQKLVYQTKKLCEEARVKYYGEHVFRHTFATNCYYKGIDVKILSKLMGHSSVQVTYNVYVNLYGDGFEDMYSALCFT